MSTRNITSVARIALAVLIVMCYGFSKDSPEGSFAAGLAHAEKGSWQAAIDAYSAAIKARPEWLEAYVNRGVAKAALGDYAGAIKDYDAALRLDPQDTDALLNRGVARHQLKQYEEALSDYTAALVLDENDVDAYCNRALTFRATGKLLAAVEDYSAAIRLEPDNAVFYRERAAVNREQEDGNAAAVDDALAKLTEAIAAAPEDAILRRQRGLVFFEVGEYALALSDLSEAIRIAPDDADTYVARAHAWFIQGADDVAIKDYTQALERHVEAAPEAYAGRGNAYESLGAIGNAVSDYEEAVRRDPNEVDTLMQLAWILATHPAQQYRNGQRAVELAIRAVALTDGRHWRALDVMAAACAEAGNFEDARKYAQWSIDLVPADMREAVRKRSTLYRSDQPYRDLGD